ncbi:hypothetical protein J6590_018212 [Homalodisca vitripennis]|nr:hypothetical protein J6590_018212 [Homalodisca vitripennis]
MEVHPADFSVLSRTREMRHSLQAQSPNRKRMNRSDVLTVLPVPVSRPYTLVPEPTGAATHSQPCLNSVFDLCNLLCSVCKFSVYLYCNVNKYLFKKL